MQTRVFEQPAFLLHQRNWQNTSMILDVFTLDYGRVSILARGGKNSQVRALMQPFGLLSISWSGRHELKTLVGLDGSVTNINQKHYLPLLYVNELLCAFLPKHEANPDIFKHYAILLKTAETGLDEGLLRIFEREMLDSLGYLPDTLVDALQGEPLRPEAYYQFYTTQGFIPSDEAEPNSISGKLIIAWNLKQFENDRVQQLAKTLMRNIIDFNLDGKTLNSREIYLQIKSRI